MGSGKRLTTEEALERIHKKCEERNYEFIGFVNEENSYKNNKTYLILKCKKCGNIWNTTSYEKFINGNRGCPNCIKNKKLTEKEIINKVVGICKEKDLTFLGINGEFCGYATKLHLRCNKCGEEWKSTTYNNFRKVDRKVHTCGRKNPSCMTISYKIEIAIESLKQKLQKTSMEFVSFDERGYIGYVNTHVLLKCKKCGKISKYLYRYVIQNNISCKRCEINGKMSNEAALKMIQEKCELLNYTFLGFNNKEDRYDGKDTKLILKCNKCGYTWNTTTFYVFIHDIIKCVSCRNSWKMEKEIESYLKKQKINYIRDCRNKILPWLKHKASLSLDFYLPDYKIGIECQGRQHFEPVKDFGGEKTFQESIERDEKKLIICAIPR